MRALNPTWILGTGADLGPALNQKARKICLLILVEMFYRQLNGNENRTIENLYSIARDVIEFLGLKATKDQREKVIENLMWSEGKSFAQFSFRDETFNEGTGEWEEHRFQFITLDHTFSNMNNGREVFKLTEESEEIIFKSQELMDELDISIQGLISEMLIRKGRYDDALTSLQNLDTKVRRLIERENEHWKQIIKDPKGAIYVEYKKWGKNLDEVRTQFNEEQERYKEMERILRTQMDWNEPQIGIIRLFNRIGVTRREHDKLANLVIGNIQKEFHFRTDPKLFSLMWNPPKTGFKATIMDEIIVPKGLQKPEEIFSVMNILFSPQKKFIYPLQWMVKKQGMHYKEIQFENDRDLLEEEEECLYRQDDYWDEAVELWTPFIEKLLIHGEVGVVDLVLLPESTLERWLSCKEAIDFWIMFLIGGTTPILVSNENLTASNDDQKFELLKKVMEQNIQLKALIGKTIMVTTINKKKIRIGEQFEMPPLKLSLA